MVFKIGIYRIEQIVCTLSHIISRWNLQYNVEMCNPSHHQSIAIFLIKFYLAVPCFQNVKVGM